MASNLTRVFCYRLVIFAFYVMTTHAGYQIVYPGKPMNLVDLMKLTKFLTFLTFVFQMFYCLVATPIERLGLANLHAKSYTVVLTFCLEIFGIYWVIYFYDAKLINATDEIRQLPAWIDHVLHTFVVSTILVDGYLKAPKAIGFSQILAVNVPILVIYNVCLEYLVAHEQVIVYPRLNEISLKARCQVYAGCWFLFLIAMILCYSYIQLLNRKYKAVKQSGSTKNGTTRKKVA